MRMLEEWRNALVFVQPATVIKWLRKRFKHYCLQKSRSKPGRPSITMKIILVIRRMSQENITWGAPRIAAELALLGHEFAESTLEAVLRIDAETVIPADPGADPNFTFQFSVRKASGEVVVDAEDLGDGMLINDRIDIRFDLNPTLEYLEVSVDDEDMRLMIPGLEVPATSDFGRISFEVGGNTTMAVHDVVGFDRTYPEVLTLANLRTLHASPYRIQYAFSMYDAMGAPIVLTQAELDEQVALTVTEDNVGIDLSESGGILHPSDDLPLDMVLVLDYSRSMADAYAGEGIAEMRTAAKQLIDQMKEDHRIGAVAFNDTGEISDLINPTTDHDAVKDEIDEFDPFQGFSPAWDAVSEGLEMLDDEGDGALRVLVFLSDGFDNSSVASPADVVEQAVDAGVRVYNIGFGNMDPTGQGYMREIASHTGGRYIDATTGSLSTAFESLLSELENNFMFSYVTGRQVGGDPAAFSFELHLALTVPPAVVGEEAVVLRLLEPISETVNPATIPGDTRRGLIGISDQVNVGSTARFLLRATHIPRDITEMGMRFTDDSADVEPEEITIQRANSGLLAAWSTIAGDSLNGFDLSGDELAFGDFGALFVLDVDMTDVAADFTLTLSLDNSVYENGVLFTGTGGTLVGDEWVRNISVEAPAAE
ncbi:MAG: hypothetical protein ACI835_005055 [Planctomycetota bacterium]|jgi:hypothetical protein